MAKSQHTGVFQERFNNAINHLGSPELSVRLGGIYTLANLGLEEEQGSYLKSVIEILCAHLRSITQNKEYQKLNAKKPSIEVQTILNVLFNNGETSLNFLANYKVKVDLSSTYLAGVNFEGSNLQKVNFSGSFFYRSLIKDSKCQLALFSECKFYKSSFENSDFTKSNFLLSIIARCSFEKNQMLDSIFFDSKIYSSSFKNVELQGSNMSYTHCLMVRFYNTCLSVINSEDPCFNSCVFSDCQFSPIFDYSNKNFISRVNEYVSKKTESLNIKFIQNKKFTSLFAKTVDEIKYFLDSIEDTKGNDLEKFKTEENSKNSKIKDCTFSYTRQEAKLWIKKYEKSIFSL